MIMENNLIIISDYCSHCNVEPEFIKMLSDDGLIDIQQVEEHYCFPVSQLDKIEKYSHLYYDLSINIAGIDAICHLLDRVEELQKRVHVLERELHFYKP